MKKIFLVLGMVLFTFLTGKAEAQTPDSILLQLQAVDESQFIGKPLDSIISILPAGHIKMVVRGIRTTARKITILYPNRVWIELHVREFTNMNPDDSNRVWNLSLMRQEKLYRTVIYKNTTCYSNCNVK
jgi:hypothetical protein